MDHKTTAEWKALEASRSALVNVTGQPGEGAHYFTSRDGAAALVREVRSPKGRARYGRKVNEVARMNVKGLLSRWGRVR